MKNTSLIDADKKTDSFFEVQTQEYDENYGFWWEAMKVPGWLRRRVRRFEREQDAVIAADQTFASTGKRCRVIQIVRTPRYFVGHRSDDTSNSA